MFGFDINWVEVLQDRHPVLLEYEDGRDPHNVSFPSAEHAGLCSWVLSSHAHLFIVRNVEDGLPVYLCT